MAIVKTAEPFDWWASRDNEGHREYHIVHKVQTNAPFKWGGASYAGDGPETISGASGLPAVGDLWDYGNDDDEWAICTPFRRIKPLKKTDEAVQVYTVESIFSTKSLNRCSSIQVEDPLDEPQSVKGSSIRYSLEASKDREDNPIMSSSHEVIRGPQVEFDSSRHQVVIGQNVADLELGLVTSLLNNLNDDTLWNLVKRRIKFSDFSWEELWYGTCTHYYRRTFTFDIRNNPKDLFDRQILDEGTKVLNGHWELDDCGTSLWQLDDICGSPPEASNPQHFNRFKDIRGENARVVLDGKGLPAESVVDFGTGTDTPGTGTDSTDDSYYHLVEYYEDADLTQLDIPTDLDFGTAAS